MKYQYKKRVKRIAGSLFMMMALLFAAPQIKAQDIHFSQFYASPLSLNPALTGRVDGYYRAVLNYRSQWFTVIDPYSTTALAFDIGLMQKKWKKDFLGAGFYMMNDKSGSGGLRNMTMFGSLAYHKALGERDKQILSIGLQGGIVNKRIDYESLIFADQIDLETLDPTGMSGDMVADPSFSYGDMNLGLMWHGYLGKKLSALLGLSMFHLFQPNESVFGAENPIYRRYVAHAGLDIMLTDRVVLLPDFIYMQQGPAKTFNVGSAVEFTLGDVPEESDFKIYAGAWYRLQDAMILLVGGEYKRVRVGLSYDHTISSLNNVNMGVGAFEMSLTYIGLFSITPSGPNLLPCRRF